MKPWITAGAAVRAGFGRPLEPGTGPDRRWSGAAVPELAVPAASPPRGAAP
jgi:hypothetical protein